MEYQLIEASKKEELVALVAEFIRNGWKPQGGVTAGNSAWGQWSYCQAMVRERPKPT